MLMVNIKNALRDQRTMSLFDMSIKFNVDPDILRDILSLLIRKGQVRKCLKTPRCGTQCSKCSELITEIYEWLEF